MHDPTMRFGGIAPPEVDRRLRDAAAVYADAPRAETLLDEAHALDPDCLPIYFARYKFYFYKSRLAEAERVAREALAVAARRGRFAADWTKLAPDAADWADVQGPAHFYLFTLKALAFIRLRRGAADETRAILARLAELDPHDSVGATVIGALANGASVSTTAGL